MDDYFYCDVCEPLLLCEYQYYYGAGCSPNRCVKFFGDGNNVYATIHAKDNGVWHHTSTVHEPDIVVDGCSMNTKIDILRRAREEEKEHVFPKIKSFSDIPYTERVNIVTSAEASGSYKMQMRRADILTCTQWETIDHILFYKV